MSSSNGPNATSRDIVRKPWESTAVSKFASRVGVDPRAQPMVIKRQGGSTILGALGEDEDHKIAGSVLQRLSTNSSDVKKSKTQNAGREMMRQEFDDPAFGVVYEHRDCFGVPKFVGSTDIVAEKQFM